MKQLHIVILSVLFAGCFAAKKYKLPKEEGVYVLKDDTYDEGVKQFDYLLVYFHAPWCGHCKAFGPEIVKAGQQLLEKDSNIKMAKVEGPENPGLLKRMNVTGYPTLFYYRNADDPTLRTEEMYQPIKYEGGRFANEMVWWCEKFRSFENYAEPLKTDYDVKQAIGNSEVIVIGFFKDIESKAAKDYLKAARDYKEYRVSFTTDPEAMKRLEVEDGQIVMFKKYEHKRIVFGDGKLAGNDFKEVNKNTLIEFVQRYSLPFVVDFNHDSAQKAFRGWVPHHLLIFASRSNHSWDLINQQASAVAKKEEFYMKLMFLTVDLDEDDHRRVLDYLHLKNETFPMVMIVNMRADIERFRPVPGVHDNLITADFGLEADKVTKFGVDFLKGDVPRFYHSQKTPDDWNDHPVKMLTGYNFEAVLHDTTKNVLVDYYAPWCGHCKELAPEWDKLAEVLKDRDDVVVATMDATLNELSHTIVRSFPTIRLYRKGRSHPYTEFKEYNGERTMEGVKKFLETDGVYGEAAPDDPTGVKRKDEL